MLYLQTVGVPIRCSRARDCTQDCLSLRDEPVQQVLTVVGLHPGTSARGKGKKKNITNLNKHQTLITKLPMLTNVHYVTSQIIA